MEDRDKGDKGGTYYVSQDSRVHSSPESAREANAQSEQQSGRSPCQSPESTGESKRGDK
jgi:hypothetical protein